MSDKTDIWMPIYIGDYLRDTTRLTTAQHGAYLLLIMDYWTSGPPPDDDAVLASITKMPVDEWAKTRAVLAAKFDVADGVWRHGRVDREIKAAKDNKQANLLRSRLANEVKAAKKAAEEALKDTYKVTSTVTDMVTVEVTPSPSPSPSSSKTPSTSTRRNKSVKALVCDKPMEVSDGVWISYLAVRRAKRAPLTDLAMLANKREAAKAGLSLEEALTFCCEANWQGFNAEWWENRQQGSRKTESFYEREQQIKRKRWEEMTGRTWPEDGQPGDVIDMQANTMLLGDKS